VRKKKGAQLLKVRAGGASENQADSDASPSAHSRGPRTCEASAALSDLTLPATFPASVIRSICIAYYYLYCVLLFVLHIIICIAYYYLYCVLLFVLRIIICISYYYLYCVLLFVFRIIICIAYYYLYCVLLFVFRIIICIAYYYL